MVETRPVKYEVSHKTVYKYGSSVSVAHHVAHLTPRPCLNQKSLRSQIIVEPAPAFRQESVDYFGNPTLFVTFAFAHAQFTVTARSHVEVGPQILPDAAATMPWERVFDATQNDLSEAGMNAAQFCFVSPYSQHTVDLWGYAKESFSPGRPVLEATLDLTRRIYEDFDYDPSATDVTTSVDEAFKLRAGVCQDLAHVEIACLRALGLPARYVSGYLLTHPPEGQEKLIGADASHAWLSIWAPGFGWVDVDPTNNIIPATEHITLAWGRDYGDVSPINGVIMGGGDHTVDVAVDVTPIDV